LPSSTDAIIPACPSSPIIGPGEKLVGPGSATRSLGAICPGLAGAEDLDCLIVLYIEKGSSFVNIKEGTAWSR